MKLKNTRDLNKLLEALGNKCLSHAGVVGIRDFDSIKDADLLHEQAHLQNHLNG